MRKENQQTPAHRFESAKKVVIFAVTAFFALASCDLLPLGDDPLYPSANVAVEAGIGRLSTLAYGQTPEDITRVEVIVTGEDVFGVLHDTFADPLTTIELSLTGTIWSGVVPSLPVGPDLVFHVFAYDATDTLIYEGVSPPTAVSAGGTSIVIPLSPYLAPGEVILFPVIQSIMRPAEIVRNTDATVTVGLKGQPGETLDLSATSGGGLFVPASTSEITGADGLVSVALIYSAPDTVGTYTHTIGVVNEQGNSVETGFSTTVVYDTAEVEVAISYAPSITGLHTQRDGDTISWEAEVSDDGPGPFTFLWGFDGGLIFTDATTNPAFLEGYDETVTGTMSLTVTDPDGLSTTIQFLLPVGQFPGSVVVDEPDTSQPGWGAAVRLEFDEIEYSSAPQVGIDATGNAIAIWQQSDGLISSVWASRFTVNSGWAPPETIESNDASSSYYAELAVSANGDAIATWLQIDGSNLNVWANRFTDVSGWSAAELLDTEDLGQAQFPQIAINASGDAFVIWYQYNGTRYNVWSSRYVTGVGFSPAEYVEFDNGGNMYYPQVAIDGSGDAIAVWQRYNGARHDIAANRYVVGLGWTGEYLLEGNDGGSAFGPQVSANSAGDVAAVWQHHDGTQLNIWGQYFVADTGWLGAAILESEDFGHAQYPQVAIDPSGNAVTVWHQSVGGRTNIWANNFVTGTGWQSAVLLESADSGSAWGPEISVDATGNALAVWYQDDGTRYDVWANRFEPGVGWGEAELIDSNSSGDAYEPQVAVNAGGDAIVIWRRNTGTQADIWARNWRNQ